MVAPPVTVGVLAVQGDVREHLQRLRESGVAATAVTEPAQLAGIDGLVLPGGESTTMSILLQREGFMEPLRDFRMEGRPLFGSCAGLILLADQVLDGRPDQQTIGGLSIAVRRNAFGRQIDSFEAQLSIPVLGPDPFMAVFIRAPLVETRSGDVEILATLVASEAIVAVRQGPVVGVSFHPELTADLRMHQYFVDIVQEYR